MCVCVCRGGGGGKRNAITPHTLGIRVCAILPRAPMLRVFRLAVLTLDPLVHSRAPWAREVAREREREPKKGANRGRGREAAMVLSHQWFWRKGEREMFALQLS